MMNRRAQPQQFSLVLGGGGARGLAHIGVLKALEREGLIPAQIVGTSMGAIIGAMYAQVPNAQVVEEKVRTLIESKPFRRIVMDGFSHDGAPDSVGTIASLYGRMKRGYGFVKTVWSPGIVKESIFLKFLGQVLREQRIEHCSIPFAAVACDIMRGKEIVLKSGPIRRAVAASSAIPGVVEPISIGGRVLVDGGPTSMVPVDAARRLSNFPVVAVTVTRSVQRTKPVANALDVFLRAGTIARMQLTELNLRDAEIVLRPRVEAYGWADFSSLDHFVKEGERVGREAVRIMRSAERKVQRAK
jgi:NTE family protein